MQSVTLPCYCYISTLVSVLVLIVSCFINVTPKMKRSLLFLSCIITLEFHFLYMHASASASFQYLVSTMKSHKRFSLPMSFLIVFVQFLCIIITHPYYKRTFIFLLEYYSVALNLFLELTQLKAKCAFSMYE